MQLSADIFMHMPMKPALRPLVARLLLCLASFAAQQAATAAQMGSFYRDATVFRDNNGNLEQDNNEASIATDDQGNFDPSGLKGKGRLYLYGGFHIVTGQPNPYTLQTAPTKAKVISPLTSLWQGLLDRGQTSGQNEAAFQTPIADANANLDTSTGDTTAEPERKAQQQSVQTDVLTQFVAALSSACYGACEQNLRAPKAPKARAPKRLGDRSLDAVADALFGMTGVDFTGDVTLRDIYGRSLTALNVNLPADSLDTLARVARGINRLARQADTKRQIRRLLQIVANAGDLLQDRNFQELLSDYIDGLDGQFNDSLRLPAPRISLAPDDDTGVKGDQTTKNRRPALLLQVGAGAAAVNLRLDDQVGGAAVPPSDGGNVWTWLSPLPLSDGVHTVQARARDDSGTVGQASRAFELTVDATPPAKPSLTSANPATVTTPTLAGAWSDQPGDSLRVFVDGAVYTQNDGLILADGQWTLSIPPGAPLASDSAPHVLVVAASDLAGNSNSIIVNYYVRTDSPPPTQTLEAPTVNPLRTVNPNPTISGLWSGGASLRLSVAVAGQTYTAANGLHLDGVNWSLNLSGLSPGVYEVVATVADAAGATRTDASSGELVVEANQAPAGGELNDTGVSRCGDYADPAAGFSGVWNNDLECDGFEPQNDPVPPGQDALHGRDALAATGLLPKIGAGPAGFDYTKLDADGRELPADAAQWSCVRDNVSRLVWEVKTDDGGLHDEDWTYTWFEPDRTRNGGKPGKKNGGLCGKTSVCDTHGHVQAVNAQGLCGARDWRLPSLIELQSLLRYDLLPNGVTLSYFPHTGNAWFWTSTPNAESAAYAWRVSFYSGNNDDYVLKTFKARVRLVRNAN
jgi:hypothetical protein